MITTEEALELMTVHQMAMTRQRQISFEVDQILENKRKLDTEYWGLEHYIISGTEELNSDQIEEFKHSIKTGESLAE